MGFIGRYLLRSLNGQKRWQWLFEKMHFISLYGMHIGGGSLFSESGEAAVVNLLVQRARGGTFTWVDAGAHDGGYSRMVQQAVERQGLRPQGFFVRTQ